MMRLRTLMRHKATHSDFSPVDERPGARWFHAYRAACVVVE